MWEWGGGWPAAGARVRAAEKVSAAVNASAPTDTLGRRGGTWPNRPCLPGFPSYRT